MCPARRADCHGAYRSGARRQGLQLPANRAYLRLRGIAATIAEPADQIGTASAAARRWSASGVLPADLQAAPRRRVRHQPLKRNRAVANRFDKLAVRYLATVRIAALAEWLR